MNIQEFLQQSTGKWFSQRSSHHPVLRQSESGTSEIKIELLTQDAPEVIQLGEQYGIDPALAKSAARITWNSTMEGDKKKHAGSTVLVPIPDPDKLNEGQLLRIVGNSKKAPVAGRYIIGSDDSLTLIVEDETIYTEDRVWFASPNLRLRTSILKQFGGFSVTSFYSEIRMGVTRQAAKTTDTAASF